MKMNKCFLAGIAVLFIVMVAVNLRTPKRYSWQPTFLPKDKNPFGCMVFDSVMGASLPNGYAVMQRTLRQISLGKKPHNVLLITDGLSLTDTDIAAIKRITSRGSKVMIAASRSSYTPDSVLMENFGASPVGENYFNIDVLKRKIKDDISGAYDTICWEAAGGVYGERIYPVYEMMVQSYIGHIADSCHDVLATKQSEKRDSRASSVMAVRYRKNKGEVYFVSTPMLFTNYGALDSNTTEFLMRLMSHIADAPVIRTTAYMQSPEAEMRSASPLQYFLSQPPLRTALYLALALILLLMLSEARRRQRIIPVSAPPVNRSLEFIETIGTLYFNRKDHSDLVRKRYLLFTEELRRLLMVDITDVREDNRNFGEIARQTGIPHEDVARMIRDIRLVADGEMVATAAGMQMHVDNMNMITDKIT